LARSSQAIPIRRSHPCINNNNSFATSRNLRFWNGRSQLRQFCSQSIDSREPLIVDPNRAINITAHNNVRLGARRATDSQDTEQGYCAYSSDRWHDRYCPPG